MFQEALPLLEHSEYHIGGFCRTAFALARVLTPNEDSVSAASYRIKGEKAARSSSIGDLGTDPKAYDQFVRFPHR